MRLSSVLSKPPKPLFEPVDGFLMGKQGNMGQKVDLDVGTVALNYYCETCDDLRTFYSKGKLTCIFVNKNMVSIDCVLACACGSTVEVWFVIESENDITSLSPKVRILKRSERLSESVRLNTTRYGDFDYLLDKAEQAYRENLGTGSIVYLRKVFEMVTVQAAISTGIDFPKYEGGNPRNFSALLEAVDAKSSIIPPEFSKDGKRLFKELSNVVHGDFDEELGLKKFEPLHRLIIGILENVRNKAAFHDAKIALGWTEEEESEAV